MSLFSVTWQQHVRQYLIDLQLLQYSTLRNLSRSEHKSDEIKWLQSRLAVKSGEIQWGQSRSTDWPAFLLVGDKSDIMWYNDYKRSTWLVKYEMYYVDKFSMSHHNMHFSI